MRAVYYKYENFKQGELVSISGDSAHHLNVVRIKPQENILLLNGNGHRVIALVQAVSKSNVELKILEVESVSRSHRLSLAIAVPKKDAFEDILKMSVELGVGEIYPLSSAYSQYEYTQSERVERIIESALIQSNNAFMPVIHTQQNLSSFLKNHQGVIAFFNSRTNDSTQQVYSEANKTILIGPEGGFSSLEAEEILKYSKIQEIHLPTPILRAPTAVASSVGYLLSEIKSPK